MRATQDRPHRWECLPGHLGRYIAAVNENDWVALIETGRRSAALAKAVDAFAQLAAELPGRVGKTLREREKQWHGY
jgi:hypothetical protein